MTPSNQKAETKNLLTNKKAFHDFQVLERFEAGIALRGTEVKSCRGRNLSVADCFVRFTDGEAFLINLHIAPYEHGNRFNHDPKRPRRLLMHKREIRRLAQILKEKGGAVIPLSFYLKEGRVKVELGLAKGKTKGDRRDDLRKRQDVMETRRAMKR